MYKKFLINFMTFSRIPLTILFCKMMVVNPKNIISLAFIFIIIIATDFFDGKLARKMGLETKIGAFLDVFSDFFFILSSGVILLYKGLYPFFLILLILLKYTEFLITSFLYKKKTKGKNIFFYDHLGKNLAAFYYCFPMIILLLHYVQIDIKKNWVGYVLYFLLFSLSLLSSVLRIKKLFKTAEMKN